MPKKKDKFIQLHILTAYGPSNLNRDDTGRPKSVFFGGVPRLRVSSQALKKSWRTSRVFQEALKGRLSVRTQRLGEEVRDFLLREQVPDLAATQLAHMAIGSLGKIKKTEEGEPDSVQTEEMIFLSDLEWRAVFEWAERALAQYRADGAVSLDPPARDEILLRVDASAADMGMFGRMVAHDHRFNREASVQVGHALTTHRSFAQDDYYTAIDDLNTRRGDGRPSAGFVGTREFGSGVFYLYCVVDMAHLNKNLEGNRTAARQCLSALVEAATTVGPQGMVNSFASHSRAFYCLAEVGTHQPRSLATAFLRPVEGQDLGNDSVLALHRYAAQVDQVYGPTADDALWFNVLTGERSLKEVIDFVTGV